MRRFYGLVTGLLMLSLSAVFFSAGLYAEEVTIEGQIYQVFIADLSEYPSWSTLLVAHLKGIINGKKGKVGPIEKKWGVDIVLNEMDYDPCVLDYATGKCDAVCITNMDVLNPSLGRKSVAIVPTSTSYGADQCIVVKGIVDNLDQLAGKDVRGMEKSVSEYAFRRELKIRGKNSSDYIFTNFEPAPAALAMQQKQKGHDAIMVWNPFCIETLNKRKDVYTLFNSKDIPAEIIDMIVIGQDSLNKPKGREFACALLETFYAICKYIDDPATHDDTVIALGEKWLSSPNLKDMERALEETIFFATPEQGISLYTNGKIFPRGKNITNETLKPIMERVVDACFEYGFFLGKPKPTISYGTKEDNSNLRFDPSFMQEVAKNN